MKRISNWSIAGGCLGLLIVLSSAIKYFIIWDDPSQGIIFVLTGLIILGLSWVYNTLLDIQNRLLAMEDFLAEQNESR